MKPICVKCRCFYRPQKNGYYFLEGMPTVNGAQPGLAEPHLWKPYKLWAGDLWRCEGCEATIIVGTGLNPISEHYMPDFAERVEQFGAKRLQVNDC